MNLRQLCYGLLSYVPGIPDALFSGTGGTDSAEYCYWVWLRHLVLAQAGGMRRFPDVVAELGPGDSIGVGLAALICGAKKYIGLDVVEHAKAPSNLLIFDELVELFRRRARIPGPERFPEAAITLPSLDFPHDIISPQQLESALAQERLAYLRRAVAGDDPACCLEYCAPWSLVEACHEGRVDLLLSQAVLEHVDDLSAVYRATVSWLRPGGYASHQIDFRSHDLFNAWDGHWACQDWLWGLFRGRKPYLLNREPLSTHLRLAEMAGLSRMMLVPIVRRPVSGKLSRRFTHLSSEDRQTCGAYLLLRKL